MGGGGDFLGADRSGADVFSGGGGDLCGCSICCGSYWIG